MAILTKKQVGEVAKKKEHALTRSKELAPTIVETPTLKGDALKALELGQVISKCTAFCASGKRDVAKIVSAITGLDIKLPKESTRTASIFKKGDIVVLLCNPNSHSYAENKPLLLVDANYAVNPLGHMGNNTPVGYEGAVRIATPAEIDTFFADMETFYLNEYCNLPNVKKYIIGAN